MSVPLMCQTCTVQTFTIYIFLLLPHSVSVSSSVFVFKQLQWKCVFYIFPHMLLPRRINTIYYIASVGIFIPHIIVLPLQHFSIQGWILMCVAFVGESKVRTSECLCEGSSCSDGDRCFGQQCFTSLSVLNGTSNIQKGCIVGNEKGPVSCGRPPTPELVIECCSGDLCNVNVSLKPLAEGRKELLRLLMFVSKKLCLF